MADDDNVIALPRPTKDEDLIFVCACGSLSFNLRGDGHCVCNICGNVLCPECCGEAPAKWYRDAPKIDKANEATAEDKVGERFETGSVELARKRVEKAATDPDVVSIHLVFENSSVRAWNKVETRNEADWLERKFQTTMEQIRAGIKD